MTRIINPKRIQAKNRYKARSVITIGEIVKGVERLPRSRRKTDLQNWLRNDLLVGFEGNFVVLETEALIEWGALTARLESAGKTMPAIEPTIAATAIANKMTLVTCYVSDFEETDAEIMHPWE